MPLLERARIEVYIPDLPTPTYLNLLESLKQEFTHTFGGCTVVSGLDGSYLSEAGVRVQDRISLIYTDAPFAFTENINILSRYVEELKRAAFAALEEEAILITVLQIYHAG
ncbi:MAG: hypothetical protein M3416_18390 [Acidobacteriota bacterium]|nr:hypothetical protein [Acidobacteriota bacterium]